MSAAALRKMPAAPLRKMSAAPLRKMSAAPLRKMSAAQLRKMSAAPLCKMKIHKHNNYKPPRQCQTVPHWVLLIINTELKKKKSVEITNKMQPCNRIYYSKV